MNSGYKMIGQESKNRFPAFFMLTSVGHALRDICVKFRLYALLLAQIFHKL